MSCCINGTSISLTRGDTLNIEVGIKDCKGDDYQPEPGDKIRFALKRNALGINQKDFIDHHPLILKDISTETMMLILDPDDTKPLAFGDYVYDIELTHADGTVDTFIPDSRFTIMREVH